MTGRLIAFVGPSGVGKDSVMEALSARCDLPLVRRVITRPANSGGEDFEGVTMEDFETRRAAGAFAIHWPAHGLMYGIPHTELAPVHDGEDRLINLSRAILPEAQANLPGLRVFLVTAPRDVLRARLMARGRETAEDIERRLDRADMSMPDGVQFDEIDNSGPLEGTLEAVCVALYPPKAAR